jgi:hypothetical protein
MNPSYNLYNDRQLIERQQTYVLERKLVTIHSEDRDVNNWPLASHFEVTLPQQLTNVQSIRLIECNFPANNYTFTTRFQNTKMTFEVLSTQFTITIDEGFYTPNQLANELTNRMNQAVEDFLGAPYSNFVVVYYDVSQKFWFGNKTSSFRLLFDKIEDYATGIPYPEQCLVLPPNTLFYGRNTKWGLPYYLGFEKEIYISDGPNADPLNFEYKQVSDPDYNWLPVGGFDVVAPNRIAILGETCFYMELDKYNDMDELRPYPRLTNSAINNSYNGMIDAAFAKIPILGIPNSQFFDSRNGLLQNMSQFFPPLERLTKVKVKFRYHDGTLVDFSNTDFSFTLEFDCYRDEMARDLSLRIPAQYRM